MTSQIQPVASTGEPLLAHLAVRFVSQRENLATEALAYILSQSENARSAMTRFFRLLGADVPDHLTYRTQAVADDQAIPDLVGEDPAGKQRVLIEAKFWAGLTPAQPLKYLERIHSQGGGPVIFLVPALRADSVWHELRRRCQEDEREVQERSAPNGCRYAELPSFSSALALMSWRDLLAAILAAVEQAGERAIASDVRQLQGLCDKEDSEAFLPLESEELTSGIVPRRLVQFCDLVDDLTSRLVDSGIGDTTGLRAGPGRGSYSRYLRVHGIYSMLWFSAHLWSSKHPTPIWLRVYGPDGKPDTRIMEQLSRTDWAGPQPFGTTEGTNFPIVLPTGVERDEVLAQAEAQIVALRGVLKAAFPESFHSLEGALSPAPEVGEDMTLSA